MFRSFIFLFLPLFFFHFIQNNASYLNDNEVLKSLRPLKYSGSCTKFCEKVACQAIKECPEGVIVKNETYCGCCEACVKYLGKCLQIKFKLLSKLTPFKNINLLQ